MCDKSVKRESTDGSGQRKSPRRRCNESVLSHSAVHKPVPGKGQKPGNGNNGNNGK